MFKKINVLIFSVLISGCSAIPQTPDEFVAAFKDVNGEGAFNSKTSEIIPSSLKLSSDRLKTKLVPCLIGTTTVTHNLIETSKQVWTAKINNCRKLSRLTVQIDYKTGFIAASNKPPKDGVYIAVIDLSYISKNKTKATYYYGAISKNSVIEPAKKILRGKKGRCVYK